MAGDCAEHTVNIPILHLRGEWLWFFYQQLESQQTHHLIKYKSFPTHAIPKRCLHHSTLMHLDFSTQVQGLTFIPVKSHFIRCSLWGQLVSFLFILMKGRSHGACKIHVCGYRGINGWCTCRLLPPGEWALALVKGWGSKLRLRWSWG